ncbi:L-lactate dehydrogenase [Lachnospiraceae bacterium]|nr:L-lactate dehydrogenase [Lachnospiraceae bacterium]
MAADKRKVVLVGCGMVGMSYAYAMMNQQTCDELVLIDYVKERAEGEAMDLNHGLAFSGSHMKIWSGTYDDCKDADIVTICAGVAQKPGESRMDLLARNTAVFKSIIEPVTDSGFNGIFLIATNPVDVMTKVACDLSGFNPKRVIGSGTSLDTARLRYLVGNYLKVDPRSIHGYVMGEHGDTEFVPWSQVCVSTKPVFDIVAESNGLYKMEELQKIEEDVRTAADKIIAAKKATYYGIGIALTRLTKAILGNENSVQTVSVYLRGEYKENGVFAGAPAIINANGVQSVLECHLTEEEQKKFNASCKELKAKVEEAEHM